MILYKDIVSGDELCTDAYKPVRFEGDKQHLNEVFIRFRAKVVTRTDSGDYDIGGNPSQEEQEEQAEGGSESGLNVILDNRLVETAYGAKKDYQSHLKEYMKRLMAHLKEKFEEGKGLDRIFGSLLESSWEDTKTKVQAAYSKAVKELVLGQFKELQFFTGEAMNTEAMNVLVAYDDSGMEADVYCWKHGVEEEKV